MKKRAMFLTIILFMLLLTFVLSACTGDSDYSKQVETEISLKEGETTDPWGVQLSRKNVSPRGMTLVCQQSGGDPTGELHTGSYYSLEKRLDDDWQEVEKLDLEGDLAWTDEAWIIPMDATVEWEVDWEWLYGQLPGGWYRIGKEITDFRETGDYDTRMYYLIFQVED